MYNADYWSILKIKMKDEEYYKLFASWPNEYPFGNGWRLNSGIERITEKDDNYLFHGYSGSIYRCPKKGHGVIGLNNKMTLSTVAENEHVELLEEKEAMKYVEENIEK